MDGALRRTESGRSSFCGLRLATWSGFYHDTSSVGQRHPESRQATTASSLPRSGPGSSGRSRGRCRSRSHSLPLDPEGTDLLYSLGRSGHTCTCSPPHTIRACCQASWQASNITSETHTVTAPSPAGLDLLLAPADWTSWLFCARLGLIWSRVDLSDQGTPMPMPICRDQHSEFRFSSQ
jgi:hypothetical protein